MLLVFSDPPGLPGQSGRKTPASPGLGDPDR